MIDHTDHAEVLQALQTAQDSNHDVREMAREAELFVTKRDGQWEPYWWNLADNRPRYQFDMCSPVIDQIAGELTRADFGITVDPAGGEATEDVARVYAGLIRNIQNISEADETYNAAERKMVESGIAGWRVIQAYADDDSFHQDFLIQEINNFVDRVWFNDGHEKADASDCDMAWVMTGFTEAEFKKKWPKANATSIEPDATAYAYFNKPELVMVGECYYYKEKEIELVLMSSGKVYEVTDDFNSITDELKEKAITEVSRRKVKKKKVYIRKFNVDNWLDEEEETAFAIIPVVPMYGNFRIVENKVVYHGAIEKMLDPQRVMNYSLSREIEEGALAPRAKYWMSEDEAEGYEASIATLNTNSDPVQFYNPDERKGGMAPQQQGGAQINPGLQTISQSMNLILGQTSGMFAANMGDNPNAQSGVAIKRLQDKGDNGTVKYVKASEVAIRQTGRILLKSIPNLYTDERMIRVIHEDRTKETLTLNETVIDNDTGKEVVLNDLSRGSYTMTVSAGPAFQNKQQETVEGMIEMAGIYPGLVDMGLDVMLSNITTPGMSTLAKRARKNLIAAGQIPLEELTEDEQMELQQMQAQQGQKQDPNMLIAQAEMGKAQAEQMNAQTAQMKEQREGFTAKSKFQIEMRKGQLSEMKLNIEANVAQGKMSAAEGKQQIDVFKAETDRMEAQIDAQIAGVNIGKTQVETTGGELDNALKMKELQNFNNSLIDFEYDPMTSELKRLN